jgi:transposase
MFESRRPIARVAEDLGIHKEALRLWVRQAEADAGQRRDLLTTDERAELKRLRDENFELRLCTVASRPTTVARVPLLTRRRASFWRQITRSPIRKSRSPAPNLA